MSAFDAREAQQQAFIDAAQDPRSTVTADDVQKVIVDQAKRAGVPAFSFDPRASVEEKRAQAAAAVPPELRHLGRATATKVVTDVDDGTGPDEDLPEPSKAGVIDPPRDNKGDPIPDQAEVEAKEEEFSRTGWAPRFGSQAQSTLEAESLLDHTTWLEGQIPDHVYGDWYHNAGVIIFACISSWLIAVLGGGLVWVSLIMITCGTYYRTSLRRVRRNFRDDITRELALKRLESDHESLEWINSFLVKFWPIYQPVLAQTVINTVDQVLSSATPAFLDSLKLKTFTLGSKPPRMEHVKTYPNAGDDIVRMDWKFSFTPTDTTDMTAKQIDNQVNPKVVLEIRIGKAMISKGLDVIVEKMSFSGIMRVNMKLQIPFPHIEKIDFCFLEKPKIDYVCKPLGGDNFGFDINFIPGLESFILDQIHSNLAPMMYAPHVFPIEVAKMLAGSPVDQAVGVLVVTLHGAQNLKNSDNFGSLDPYAILTLNRRQELARTKAVEDNANPRWNETHYIIVTSLNDTLDIQVWDKNGFRKSKELGAASFPLERLENLHVYENERLEVHGDGKSRGFVSCDLRYFPVLEATKDADGKEIPPPPSNSGILRFTVEQAKDLDGTKSLVGLLNPYALMYLNGKQVHQTKKMKRTNNPIWENGSKEIFITDRKRAKLGVTLKDERELQSDPVLGKYQIKLDDLLDCMDQGKEWYHLAGAQTGRVKMMAQWKPVAISGVVGTGGYSTPIGVVRLHFQKAMDLRNFETIGKSDPYVRVLLSGVDKGRTVTCKNDLNPSWDEVLYVPVTSPRDVVTLEVMDEESVGKDRSLGVVDLSLTDLIQRDEAGEYLVHSTKQFRQDGLRLHGKGMIKGTIVYSASFFPCLNVADPEDEEEEEPAEKQDKETAVENGTSGKDSFDKPRESVETSRTSVDTRNGSTAKNSLDIDEADRPTSSASSLARPSVDSGREGPKIRLSPEELLKHESGLLIFRLLESEMPADHTQLQVFVDDMAFPSYTSSTAASRAHKFDEIGDCVIRELDFSRLTIKARKKGGDDDDDTLAYLSGNTLETLKQCLNNPTTLKLKSDDGKVSWVKISLKYLPIKMNLDPSESINNMGNLRVDVLSGVDLPAADRNGKSDPYCKFELNGTEVFKTKVQKKTLSPVWNESFEVTVPSRTAAQLVCNVYDYDFADKPDFLGASPIDLASLVPFRAQEINYMLDGKSGSIRLRLLFRPAYITRARQGTSTFQGTFSGAPGRIVTGVAGVAGVPLKGGVAVAGVVGHGVGKGASLLKRGILGRKERDDPNGSMTDLLEIPVVVSTASSDAPSAGSSRRPSGATEGGVLPTTNNDASALNMVTPHHNRTRSFGASSAHSGFFPAGAPAGTATFTIVGASGFSSSTDLYIVITQISPREKVVGKTRHFKSHGGQWSYDETFKFLCSADAQFKVEARGEHLFGSDDGLGEHAYFIDETGMSSARELSVGPGVVVIKSSFQPAEQNYPDSPKSHRRGFLNKRDSRGSRESTPNA
ncbi:Uncharacterized protein ESCO_000750 [Escovopsis weberi]|uniref:Tricalbin-1 n=1 Tax=Escovopsis weberi TaxID=150374 RepID=A0A0M9VTF3_ESCWE|nr:Uncharacterized protein ESCO_000750 [Escovopsis weberi]